MSLVLPPEDHPADFPGDRDVGLRRQLELSTQAYFFEACNGSIQALLMECRRWNISVTKGLLLIIHCPDAMTNWRGLNRLAAIAEILVQFSALAKIRVFPSPSQGNPFDMRINERSEYRDGRQHRS
ncbi:MAG: hypothetical protein AAGG53_00685 [Cyanobacteria bacterium P01_H01_bin.152]